MFTNDPPSPLRSGSAYDVIVVGAGAAGAATAMLLARGHVRTLVLDHGVPGSTTPSPPALSRGGVLQLSRWNVLEGVVAAGTPAVKRTTLRHGREQQTTSIKPSPGVGALYAPRRALLDALLLQAASTAGAEVHQCIAVTDVVVRGGRVVGVRAMTADHRFVDLDASLVVGADGIRSTIAARLGATYTRLAAHSSAMTYAYWPGVATTGYEWNFRPNACSGAIPTNDGLSCVFASATPERIGDGGTHVIADIVAQTVPQLGDHLRRTPIAEGPHTWTGHPGFIRRSHGPGWALVGDAGCFTDPIGTHGVTAAFRDAELLARAVVGSVGNTRLLDSALGDYEETRDRLGLPMFDAVERIAGQRWTETEIARLLQQLSSAMAEEAEVLATFGSEAA